DRLAQNGIRDADDGGLPNPRQGVEDVLDFLGAYLLSPRLDDIILAAQEVKIALLILPEKVPTVKDLFPGIGAGSQATIGCLWIFPVSLHDMTAPDHELTGLAR